MKIKNGDKNTYFGQLRGRIKICTIKTFDEKWPLKFKKSKGRLLISPKNSLVLLKLMKADSLHDYD